jgi:hypothetical protein
MTGMLGISRMSEEGINADPVNDTDPANDADPVNDTDPTNDTDPRTTLVVDNQS